MYILISLGQERPFIDFCRRGKFPPQPFGRADYDKHLRCGEPFWNRDIAGDDLARLQDTHGAARTYSGRKLIFTRDQRMLTAKAAHA